MEAHSTGRVIEVKPLAMTVPALILMEAHIIAHAIKNLQMLSGSAHIVISQCNTSLIFVVFFCFQFFSPPSSFLCEEEEEEEGRIGCCAGLKMTER